MLERREHALPTPHPPSHMRRGHRLALQATLQVQPADKRLSLVFRIGLMIGPSLIERFDSFEASNLLARKTHVLELQHVRQSGELLSEFHGHPPVSPSKRVAGCTTANVRYPGSRMCISQFSLDRLPGICLIVDVQWRYWPDILGRNYPFLLVTVFGKPKTLHQDLKSDPFFQSRNN
jgi:hypothetical protein